MNKEVKLGIAPIAWTNDDLPELGKENTFEQCISEMALAGYSGCEIGNKYPKDVSVLEKYLSIRNLSICNAWYSTYFTVDEYEKTIEGFIQHRDFLNQLGAKVIGISEQGDSIQGRDLPIFDNKPIYDEAKWQKVVKGFNILANLAEEKGMKLCVHHHMGTGVQTSSEIDELMQRTDPNVNLLFDTGHLYYSDHSQRELEDLLRKYANRICHVHLKDVRERILQEVRSEKWSFLNGVKMGVFTVPGDGVISFDEIFHILDENNYRGWMVVEAEQDPAVANPYEYALKARKFIKEKAGI